MDIARLPPRSLFWPVISRFSDYIARLPDGQIGVQEGADFFDMGYTFELVDTLDFDATTFSGVIRFRGDLRFSGHSGMLFVMIAQPALDLSLRQLTVQDVAGWPDPGRRIVLATLGPVERVAEADQTYTVTAFLAEEGSLLFNSAYPVGTQIDTLTFRLEG